MIRLVCAAMCLWAGSASAVQIPRRIDFQGKIADSLSVPRNGTVPMRFSIYAVPSGGSALYDEPSPAGFVSVPVVDGVFSVQIGSSALMSENLFSGTSAYLGITISGDAEMTPRVPLVASPYAFTAMQLVSDGDIRINADVVYATFTAAGNLAAPGVAAGTGTFRSTLSASSGTFTGADGVEIRYGLLAGSVTLTSGMTASSGTFLATGNTQYSLKTSSGVDVKAGTVFVEGDGGLVVTNNVRAANFGLELLALVELGGANATLDTGTFAARKRLVVYVDAPAPSATGISQLQFNGDTTASNYNDKRSDSNGAVTSNTGGTAKISLHEANNTRARNSRIDIVNGNAVATIHPMMIHTTVDGGAGAVPLFVQAAGIYRNTAQITRIVLSLSSAATYPAGTRMMVFGSND